MAYCFLSPITLLPKRSTTRVNIQTNRSQRTRVTVPCAVLPALAEVADTVTAAADAAANAAATAVTESDFIPTADPLSVNLGRLTFVLTIFCTFGSLVLTWDDWRKNRNAERSLRDWEAEGGENRPRDGSAKTLTKSGSTGVPGAITGDNRQTRRFRKKQEAAEKKLRKEEEKAKKQRAKKN